MDKRLIELYVPIIDQKYDILLPCNKRIKNVIILLANAINDLTDNEFPLNSEINLYNKTTGELYDIKLTVKEANILNGTKLILY